jgi:predicted RNA-binding protein with PUA-like domain
MSPRRCWIFKSEPSCFSFADLQSRPDATEQWDGVRNYQARNYLRDEVKVGDRVLFYHSSIPEPAIVGIAEVVREGYPDWTARDPDGEHFDPRSTAENPVWFMVDVKAVAELSSPVTLAAMRSHHGLSAMPLLNRSRLSIQPVADKEERIIMGLAGMAA